MTIILEGLCFIAIGVILLYFVSKAIDLFTEDDDANKS